MTFKYKNHLRSLDRNSPYLITVRFEKCKAEGAYVLGMLEHMLSMCKAVGVITAPTPPQENDKAKLKKVTIN